MPHDTLHLRLFGTTDIHGFYMNFDYYNDQIVDKMGLISLHQVLQAATKELKHPENRLLFDNGDLLQGSPLADYMREYADQVEHPAYTLMNALQYDAATLGNHEFNFGVPFLLRTLKQAKFPYVNANIIRENGENFLSPFVILERTFITERGRKVALKIGVTGILPPQITKWDRAHLEEYAESHERLKTIDAVEAVRCQIPKMKAAGADLIILLAHTGYSTDPYEVGMENSGYHLAQLEGIDLLIAGHQHRRFPSEDYQGLVEAGFAFNIEKGSIHNTASMMPGSWARWLGVADLILTESEKGWRVEDATTHLRAIDQYLPDNRTLDAELMALMEPAHKAARAMMNIAVGHSNTGFYSYLSLVQDDACIQIVADSQKYYAQRAMEDDAYIEYQELPMLSAVPLFKVGSRKDDPSYYTEIPPGALSFKDIADLYVYPNHLVVLKLSGQDLREWLECCASLYRTIDPTLNRPQHLVNWEEYRTYNFDVIKGVTYTIDPTAPPRYDGDLKLLNEETQRISRLAYAGKPVKDDDQFLLATNSYRALVDRFPGAGEENVVYSTMKEIPEVILHYIAALNKEGKGLSVTVDYNWGLDGSNLLSTTEMLVESSPSKRAKQYIEEQTNGQMHYFAEDSEGFGLYRFCREAFRGPLY